MGKTYRVFRMGECYTWFHSFGYFILFFEMQSHIPSWAPTCYILKKDSELPWTQSLVHARTPPAELHAMPQVTYLNKSSCWEKIYSQIITQLLSIFGSTVVVCVDPFLLTLKWPPLLHLNALEFWDTEDENWYELGEENNSVISGREVNPMFGGKK